jgi:hypothetical protein
MSLATEMRFRWQGVRPRWQRRNLRPHRRFRRRPSSFFSSDARSRASGARATRRSNHPPTRCASSHVHVESQLPIADSSANGLRADADDLGCAVNVSCQKTSSGLIVRCSIAIASHASDRGCSSAPASSTNTIRAASMPYRSLRSVLMSAPNSVRRSNCVSHGIDRDRPPRSVAPRHSSYAGRAPRPTPSPRSLLFLQHHFVNLLVLIMQTTPLKTPGSRIETTSRGHRGSIERFARAPHPTGRIVKSLRTDPHVVAHNL